MDTILKHLYLAPLAVLLLHAPNALAGRPLVTEDADVLEPHHCEWESFGLRAKAPGLEAAHGGSTQFGCGVGLRSQVALGLSRSRADGDTAHGLALSGKTQILPRTDDQPLGLTLAWGATWLRSSGGGTHHDATNLTLVATRAWAPGLLTHANLGWVRDVPAAQDTIGWNLAIEKSLDHGVDVMAEVFDDDRQRHPWLGTGLRWTFREDLSVNASLAQQTSTRERQVTLGFKWAF